MIGEFTKPETATLLRLFNEAMGGNWTPQDHEAVMSWATNAKLDSDLLVRVLQGHLAPWVDVDGRLKFKLTAKAKENPASAAELEKVIA